MKLDESNSDFMEQEKYSIADLMALKIYFREIKQSSMDNDIQTEAAKKIEVINQELQRRTESIVFE